ncbi:MAG TPA: hypothetical protein VGF23_19170 [Gaiellaceae bacterium]
MSAVTARATQASATVWHPTRKWWAATILGISGFLGTLAGTGWHWSNAMSTALIALIAQRVVAYLVPNQPPASTE